MIDKNVIINMFKTKKWSKENRKVWTSVEDKLLKDLINIHGTKWIRIS